MDEEAETDPPTKAEDACGEEESQDDCGQGQDKSQIAVKQQAVDKLEQVKEENEGLFNKLYDWMSGADEAIESGEEMVGGWLNSASDKLLNYSDNPPAWVPDKIKESFSDKSCEMHEYVIDINTDIHDESQIEEAGRKWTNPEYLVNSADELQASVTGQPLPEKMGDVGNYLSESAAYNLDRAATFMPSWAPDNVKGFVDEKIDVLKEQACDAGYAGQQQIYDGLPNPELPKHEPQSPEMPDMGSLTSSQLELIMRDQWKMMKEQGLSADEAWDCAHATHISAPPSTVIQVGGTQKAGWEKQ